MATTRLHVAGIAPNTTADDLRQLFAGVARVAKVTIPPPRDPKLPRGYAFVEVKNAADADACVAAYDNATWQGGRKLAVAGAATTSVANSALTTRSGAGNRRRAGRPAASAPCRRAAAAGAERAFRGRVSARRLIWNGTAPAAPQGAVPRPAPRARSPRTVTSTPLPPESSRVGRRRGDRARGASVVAGGAGSESSRRRRTGARAPPAPSRRTRTAAAARRLRGRAAPGAAHLRGAPGACGASGARAARRRRRSATRARRG